jgi:dTMP kinase
LAIILNADAAVIADRLTRRGRHSRFERQPHSSEAESTLYHDAAARLTDSGWPVHVIDCTARTPSEVAAILISHILTTCHRKSECP